MEKRLQKILSEMGIASRRKAEDMILEGRVTVNGALAELGTKADPAVDHVKVDGKLLTGSAAPRVYLAFHKPRNVMTTLDDPEGRPTVADYLKRIKGRVFPVGRLDFDSEGLLLLTSDGEFAHALTHPSHHVPKTYQVKIKGFLEDADVEKLRRGIYLDDGRTAPAEVRKLKKLKENSWIEIVLYEGRKRQIRRMLNRVGHPVSRLIRTKIGPLKLQGLGPGDLRYLDPAEVEALWAAAARATETRG